MNAELIQALDQIEKEKHISKEILIEAIENSLLTACKNQYGNAMEIHVEIDRIDGNVSVHAVKEVVAEVEDSETQISLEDARKSEPTFEVGDKFQIEVTPKDFGRIAAQKAKQVVVQKIKEAEREMLLEDYNQKKDEVVTGIIQRNAKDSVIVDLGKIDGILSRQEQVANEKYTVNRRIKVYVTEVKDGNKGPKVYVSRRKKELVARLFEQEVPEVYNGTVEIKSISREPGIRTKIAVHSNKKEIDAIGACVGHNGARVEIVVEELYGEKIDIIPWSEEIEKFIAASLSPSKVLQVAVDVANRSARVIVPDYQLSLAIGKEGQNAKLAAGLTGYKIDIKNETQAAEMNFITEQDHENEEILIFDKNFVPKQEIAPFDESLMDVEAE